MKKDIDIDSIQKKDYNPNSDYLPLTRDSIEIVEEAVKKDQVYGDGANGGALEKYFSRDKNKKNKDKDIILHKIMLIDYTYSTNLAKQKSSLSIFQLADIIKNNQELDSKIEHGDISIVADLLKEIPVNLFSFVSKYCTINNYECYHKDAFSIYDNIVADVIPQYLDIEASEIDKWKRNKQYYKFHSLITRMIELYNLDDINNKNPKIRRKLDHFLWYPNRLINIKVAIEKVLNNIAREKNNVAQFPMPRIIPGKMQYQVKLKNGLNTESANSIKRELKKKLKIKNDLNVWFPPSVSDHVFIEIPCKEKDRRYLESLHKLRKEIMQRYDNNIR